MKRILVVLAVLLMAQAANAQVVCVGGACSTTVAAVTPSVTTVPGCTGWLLYADASGKLNCAANMTFDGTTVTLNTATELRSSPNADTSKGFFNLTGTMLATTTDASVNVASRATFTTAGSQAARDQVGELFLFSPGYTGTGVTKAMWLYNNVAGANTAIGGGNVALFAQSQSTSPGTWNTPISVIAVNSSATGNAQGIYIRAFSAAQANAGIVAQVNAGTTSTTGIYAGLKSTTPALVNASIQLDNGANAFPIIYAQDNGTKVWSLEDGGSQWAANAKTLTESSATAFARFTIASGSSGGLNIDYCIEANDTPTHFQSRCGTLPVAVENTGGAIVCTVGTVAASTEVVAVTAAGGGTLTNAFTCVDSGTNFLDIQANAASSLTQTTLRINYFPRQEGNVAVAFTPQ